MVLVVFILSMIPSAICFIIAAILAVKERDGWGWFLFVGFLLGGAVMSTSNVMEWYWRGLEPPPAMERISDEFPGRE